MEPNYWSVRFERRDGSSERGRMPSDEEPPLTVRLPMSYEVFKGKNATPNLLDTTLFKRVAIDRDSEVVWYRQVGIV